MTASRKIELLFFSTASFGFTEANKPFLVLTMPDTEICRSYITQGIRRKSDAHTTELDGALYSALGTITYEPNLIKIYIEGKYPVFMAINSFQREISYSLWSSNHRIELRMFQRRVTEMISAKKFPPPPIHKMRDKYKVLGGVIDDVFVAHKKTKSESKYVYKQLRSLGGAFAKRGEVEAAGAAFFRFMMGHESVPKTRCVYDQSPQTIAGVFSQLIEEFLTAEKYFSQQEQEMSEEEMTALLQTLISAGLVPMLIATYVLADYDLHDKNWGFNKDLKIARIDFGRTFWPISSKYSQIFPGEFYLFSDPDLKYIETKPVDAFNFSAEEMISFPNLTTTKPANWFTGFRYDPMLFDLAMIALIKEFIQQKWKYFLKATLMSKTFIEAIFTSYMSPEKTRNKFIAFMTNRMGNFESILMDIEEFRQFLNENKQVKDELIAEVEKYNAGLKEKYSGLKADVDAAKEKLDSLFLAAQHFSVRKQ